jgi:hypothetical protein
MLKAAPSAKSEREKTDGVLLPIVHSCNAENALGPSGERYGPTRSSERFRTRLSYSVVLLSKAAAYTHRPHYLIPSFEWDAAGKDHDLALVRSVNPKELIARLTQLT